MKNLDKIEVMSKAESNFLKVIVRPLWAIMNNFLEGEIKEVIDLLDQNIIEWEKSGCGSPVLTQRTPVITQDKIVLNILPCDEVIETEEKKNQEQGTQSASLTSPNNINSNNSNFLTPSPQRRMKNEFDILKDQSKKALKKVDFDLLKINHKD